MFFDYLFAGIIFVLVSLLLVGFDIKLQKIPVIPVICGSLLIIMTHVIFNISGMWIYILSSFINLVVYFFAKKLSGDKLGTGDIYFSFFCGLIIKPYFLWLSMICNVVFALPFFIKKTGTTKLPFIPFMSAGCLIAFITGLFF